MNFSRLLACKAAVVCGLSGMFFAGNTYAATHLWGPKFFGGAGGNQPIAQDAIDECEQTQAWGRSSEKTRCQIDCDYAGFTIDYFIEQINGGDHCADNVWQDSMGMWNTYSWVTATCECDP